MTTTLSEKLVAGKSGRGSKSKSGQTARKAQRLSHEEKRMERREEGWGREGERESGRLWKGRGKRNVKMMEIGASSVRLVESNASARTRSSSGKRQTWWLWSVHVKLNTGQANKFYFYR